MSQLQDETTLIRSMRPHIMSLKIKKRKKEKEKKREIIAVL